MKRLISLLACVILVYSFSFQAFATTEYIGDNYFVGITKSNSTTVPVEYVDNDDVVDFGTDEWSDYESGAIFGAEYRPKNLTSYDSYTFVVTITYSAGVVIDTNTAPYAYMYKSYISGDDVYWGQQGNGGSITLCSDEPVVEKDGVTITYTFSDIPWDIIDPGRLSSPVYFMYLPRDYLRIGGGFYLVNMYLGLSSEYDEAGYSKAVNEKLDGIQAEMEANGEKLDQIVSQDQQHHEEEMSQDQQHHEEEMSQSAAQHEETKGLLGTIIDGITSIPEKIKAVFKALIDEVVGSVTDKIESAMDGFLEDLKDKLGILYQAPDYFVRIINAIMTTETSNELTFPSMVIPVAGEKYTFNEPTPFQIFPDWIPKEVYTFINLAFSIIVIFSVINFADKKWEEITTNG